MGLIAVVLVIGLLLWGGRYVTRVAHDAREVLGMVPAIKGDYQAHQWVALVGAVSAAEPHLQQLQQEVIWIRTLDALPVVGRDVKDWDAALRAAVSIGQAAHAVRPLIDGGAHHHPLVTAATWEHMTPHAVLASARAVEALLSLPATLPGVPPHDLQDLRAIKAPLIPLAGVARLVMTHPKGVGWILDPQHTERYLVLFQDSGELRTTGGFLAAYGYLTFHAGRVTLTMEPEISALGRQIRLHLRAPWVLRQYFGQKTLSFINANMNPDVPQSARTIEELYRSVPRLPAIQGIVFADSWLADRVLGQLGPVTADGVQFTGRNLNYEMEYMAEDRRLPSSTRMLFLGHIAQTLVQRIRTTPAGLPGLLPVLSSALAEKHLMIYADNAAVERWLVAKRWAGAIPKLAGANSLMVVNGNYGGLKDNYYMASHVAIALRRVSSGQFEETVTTQWTMRGVRNGWLVGPYVGWVECYVPAGTRLLRLTGRHMHGIRETGVPSLDRTVFGTGILVAARANANAPLNHRTLRWVFLLPRLKHPMVIHLFIQPGLPVQTVTYDSRQRHVTIQQEKDQVIRVAHE